MTRTTSLLLALLAAAVSCKREAPPADKPAADDKPLAASTVKVETKPMPRYVTLTGSLVADSSSAVAADVTG